MKRLITIAMLSFINFAYASESFGDVAKNMLQPLTALSSLVHAVCFIAGAGMLGGAFIRYRHYRNNPVEATLSSVIALIIIGIALIVLGLIPMPVLERP